MRAVLIAWALVLSGVAIAQEKSPTQRGVEWLRNAWATMQREGRPAAERAVRQFPEKFREVPARVQALRERYEKTVGAMKLEERRALLVELWRVRQCVDVLTLLEPKVLEQLTGIDSKTLKRVGSEIARLRSRLVIS